MGEDNLADKVIVNRGHFASGLLEDCLVFACRFACGLLGFYLRTAMLVCVYTLNTASINFLAFV